MRERQVVAVVGGGSVGVSFLIQLVEATIKQDAAYKVEILLFEPKNSPGPGAAYQEDYRTNLLNTRADTMSAVAGNRRHFLDWLEDNRSLWEQDFPGVEVAAEAFLPRNLFGRYLMHTFHDTVAKARAAGIHFKCIEDRAVDVVPCHDGSYYLDTLHSGAYRANRVVLCCGNLESTNFPGLAGVRNFYNNPYPGEKYARSLARNASVCILGTNLSAIDTAISLIEGGHQGKIVCVSRNGRLPSVRGTINAPVTLQLMTRQSIDAIVARNGGSLRLEDVASLLKSEYERSTGKQLDLAAIMNLQTGTYDYLNTEIEQSATQQRFWQSVIYATNSIVDYIWHKLDLAEKIVFQSTMKALWYSYRVSFPLENALKIREYMRKDRLSVFGGFVDVQANEQTGTFGLKIADARTGFRSTIDCDAVINATSYSTDVAKSDDRLVKNLLRRQLAVPDEFGGFALDFESGLLMSENGRINAGISVLGSLATGTYFWTNAMDVNARLAACQAIRIAGEISNAQSAVATTPVIQLEARRSPHAANPLEEPVAV
jgi:uncharacterized NAD(P)/FAD-binding protein YdhS